MPQKLSQLIVASLITISIGATGIAAQQDGNNNQFAETEPEIGLGDEGFTEPAKEIKVAAAEMGIIKNIHVELGQPVQPGDLLIEMDMSVLEATLRVAQSKANTRARLRAAQVEFETKQIRLEKLVQLEREGAGSPEEVQRARADAEVARQNTEAIVEETERFKLEVKQYEAQIERRRIRSPIKGIVVEIKKKLGEHVSTNDPHIVTVVKLDRLRAVFHIPTWRASQIKKGDLVQVHLTETKRLVQARVEYVAPITKAASGRVRVDVLIDNSAGEFRSGVRCRLDNKIVHRSASDRRQR